METPAARTLDPFGLGALVAAGTLAAHQMGYLTDAETRTSHTYLSVVGPAVLLIAFLAAWAAALRILQRDAGRAPSLIHLSALQISLYVVMEVAERVAGDGLSSMWSTPVVLGMLAQPVVAWAALRLLTIGGRVLLMLAPAPASVPPATAPLRARAPEFVVLIAPRAALRLRGPPVH